MQNLSTILVQSDASDWKTLNVTTRLSPPLTAKQCIKLENALSNCKTSSPIWLQNDASDWKTLCLTIKSRLAPAHGASSRPASATRGSQARRRARVASIAWTSRAWLSFSRWDFRVNYATQLILISCKDQPLERHYNFLFSYNTWSWNQWLNIL